MNEVCVCVCLVAQSSLTLCHPMDFSPQGSSADGIFQARILEWVAISFPRGSFWPTGWTRLSCIAGRFFGHLSHQGSPASCYWEVPVQTPGARCVFHAQPPSIPTTLGGGSMLPSPHCSMGRIPVHLANGHQTQQGGRPWRRAVIRRKKPLRGL